MKVSVSNTDFLFYRKNNTPALARAPFATLTPTFASGVTVAEKSDIEYELAEYQAGEEFKHPSAGVIILGPAREFTHVVQLHACGNPDYSQYADIGPKKMVHVTSIEEAVEVCMAYQNRYGMGGGNCGRKHGDVYELKDGERKKVGSICYGGRYDTLAEIRAFKAKMKAAYGKS